MPPKFPLDHWIKAVQWHGDSKVAAVVNTMDEWVDAQKLLTPLENIVVEAESTQGTVVWSSTQKDHPAILEDSLPLKLVVRPEHDIQRHLPHTLQVEATGLGGRDLTHPIPWTFQLDRTKRGSRYMGPLSHLWKILCLSIITVGALRPYKSLLWVEAELPMNSWCFTTLPWTVPNIGMRFCHMLCQRSSSRVLKPVGPLLWKLLVHRTFRPRTAGCLTFYGRAL